MRPIIGLGVFVALCAGGCSLLFSGNNLHGRSDGGGGSGGTGGSGGDGGDGGSDLDMGAGGSGGAGGGGGSSMCTPKTMAAFTVTHPDVGANDGFYMAASDIDGDGKVDLVSSNYNSNSISVLLGDGAGHFAAATMPMSTCANPLDIIARDITKDGHPDLIVSCWDTTNAVIDVYVNTSTPGTVSFAAAKSVALAAQAYYFPVTGTFDASANVGLALVGNSRIYFFAGGGNGTFTPSANFAVGASGESPSAAVGKLNGDAIDDVIVYNYDDNDMTMLLSSGATYTTTRLAYDTTDMSPGGQVYFGSTPTLVDYDGDGKLDIVIAQGTSVPGQILFYKNGGSTTAPSFTVQPTGMVNVGDIPGTVAFADLNCDGKANLVSSSNGCDDGTQGCTNGMNQPPQLWVLPGQGATFGTRQTTSIEAYCDNLLIQDFNGDGSPDIACGGSGTTINLLISQ